MWVVKGKTVSGKEVEYKVPAGKDTDKAFVMALAFQEHGKAEPDDALTAETTVSWISDNVVNLAAKDAEITLSQRQNFAVDRQVAKGVWERQTTRAYRTLDSACDALESAASEFLSEKYRIVETTITSVVVAVSKNAFDTVSEKPDAPEEPKSDTSTATGDAPTVADAPAKSTKRTPKAA